MVEVEMLMMVIGMTVIMEMLMMLVIKTSLVTMSGEGAVHYFLAALCYQNKRHAIKL